MGQTMFELLCGIVTAIILSIQLRKANKEIKRQGRHHNESH